MISAERMKSVRIAPATIAFSWSGPDCAAVAVSWPLCPLTFSQTFSAPS